MGKMDDGSRVNRLFREVVNNVGGGLGFELGLEEIVFGREMRL